MPDELECCPTPQHEEHTDNYDDWIECRNCHAWWTLGEYDELANEDKIATQTEVEYYEYGRRANELRDDEMEYWPMEVYPPR